MISIPEFLIGAVVGFFVGWGMQRYKQWQASREDEAFALAERGRSVNDKTTK